MILTFFYLYPTPQHRKMTLTIQFATKFRPQKVHILFTAGFQCNTEYVMIYYNERLMIMKIKGDKGR